jgi:selenocysteine lyase/cysteine desulfurase
MQLLISAAISISTFSLVCILALAKNITMTPELGRGIRSQFLLEAKYTSLNHGSFGSIPKQLVPILNDLRLKSEINPDRWLRREMFPELDKNKETLANLIHADPEELVFVFNAMTGINTVARSLPLEAGDKVIYVSIPREKKEIQD